MKRENKIRILPAVKAVVTERQNFAFNSSIYFQPLA
jgi:hypothetical protein